MQREKASLFNVSAATLDASWTGIASCLMFFKADYEKNSCFVLLTIHCQSLWKRNAGISIVFPIHEFKAQRLKMSTAPLQNEELSVPFHHICVCKEEPLYYCNFSSGTGVCISFK